MRRLGRLAMLAFALLALWGAANYLARYDPLGFLSSQRDAWKLDLIPLATISTGYVVERERWLIFPVPTETKRVRIASTGNLRDLAKAKASRTADPMKRWQYALEIEALDKRGAVVLNRKHHYLTDFSEIEDAGGRLVTPSYYLSESSTPTNGAVIHLDLTGLPQIDKLRIRTIGMDSDLTDLLVRVYFPEHYNEQRLAYLWQRLSEKQKNLLAKGNVYAQELLIEEERRNLMRNMWQPAGPQGSQGVDFLARELYILRDFDGEPVDEPIMPAGVLSSPGRLAVFAIPEHGGTVRFSATAVTMPDLSGQARPTPQRATLNGRWFGPTAFARSGFSLTWEQAAPASAIAVAPAPTFTNDKSAHRALPPQPTDGMAINLGGGLVEIEASAPLALRAFMKIEGKETEITPERLYRRLFFVDPGRPLSFAIAHAGEQPTPLRLELRYLLQTTPDGRDTTTFAASPKVRYEFLDVSGAILKAAELPLQLPVTRYDRMLNAPLGIDLSDYAEYYFLAPPKATQLRLVDATGATEHATILATLSSRPHELRRDIRAPEDAFLFASKGLRVPAWFPVRPLDYERIVLGNRSLLITTQYRPPEDKPDILAGRFAWEDLRPKANDRWRARQLLIPKDAEAPFREEALIASFEPLTPGKALPLRFPPYLGVEQLTPSVIWLQSEEHAFVASVTIDGRLHHRFSGKGPYGEIKLPPLAAGRHTLRIDCDRPSADLRFHINHAHPSANALTQRTAIQLAGGSPQKAGSTIAFEFDRLSRDEETVTARLFQPLGWRGRTTLRVHVDGPNLPTMAPLPAWIFEERRIDVRPDPSFAAPIFDTRGKRNDAGQPVYIPFPKDAPLGRYRLNFSIVDGPPAYLAVSRITPGVPLQRRIFEEAEPRHEAIEP